MNSKRDLVLSKYMTKEVLTIIQEDLLDNKDYYLELTSNYVLTLEQCYDYFVVNTIEEMYFDKDNPVLVEQIKKDFETLETDSELKELFLEMYR